MKNKCVQVNDKFPQNVAGSRSMTTSLTLVNWLQGISMKRFILPNFNLFLLSLKKGPFYYRPILVTELTCLQLMNRINGVYCHAELEVIVCCM
jgi:hypothetical protein